jgi:hypothetical protein
MELLPLFSFFSGFLVVIPPFFYIYVLSKRFKKYAETLPALFIAGLFLALMGFVLEAVDILLGMSDVRFGGRLSLINFTGTVFLMAASILFYMLTDNMISTINGRKNDIVVLIPLSTILFSLLLTLHDDALAATNSALSFLTFAVLFYALLNVYGIYKRFLMKGADLVPIASALLTVHMFYQIYWLLALRADELLYLLRFMVSITIFLLAIVPAVYNFRAGATHRTRVTNSFLSEIYMLIGGASLTILKRAMEGYDAEHGTSYALNPYDTEMMDENRELADYVANYFERCIGPVAIRIYREGLYGRRV